ncbi:MAG: DUF4198 domain-containing protein [Pseudomonadota bacterium]
MNFKRIAIYAAAAATVASVPIAVQAHRMWMLPSSTVLSGDEAWVTVDAAVSNELFYFDHQPLRGEPSVTAPDGTATAVENYATGRYRSTFDLHLTQQGTYKIAYVRDAVMGSYTLNGEEKRLPRGLDAAKAKEAIPASATDVRLMEMSARNEIFVTLGAPTNTVFKPTGKGIELVPVTHPNDLFAGEAATFQFLLDGKPAANMTVTVIPGGIRYRDQLNQMVLKTDTDGKVSITWPTPGMYWLNVSPEGEHAEGEEGKPQGPRQAPPSGRRVSYTTTLEVLAP